MSEPHPERETRHAARQRSRPGQPLRLRHILLAILLAALIVLPVWGVTWWLLP
ncbi:hypothetical protein [Microvirga sp. 17 mud 1-3]|uniref:hypothetical protein n=1 Tax=Microvirga sp. 17 mud 1-3 TaxID=2082949 RepID=UPI0013A56AD0|nr:hypothetical protein [Microvirga sp. 17 mud 1-3]